MKHARRDQAEMASKHELRVQIAIATVLAMLAVMWIVLAAREASAEPSRIDQDRRDGARHDGARNDGARNDGARNDGARHDGVRHDGARHDGARHDGARHEARRERVADADDIDDDNAVDVAAPPTREAPFGAPVVAPPIAEVVAAAYRTSGLDRDLGGAIVRRSRLAGLVPLVSVRTGRNTSWRDDDPDVSRGMTLEVRATWRLDRLVFDGRELQVAALEASRRRERRRLAARVIQVYFAWKRAARAAGIQPRAATMAEEAAAELDDLTDGWFTEAREGQRP